MYSTRPGMHLVRRNLGRRIPAFSKFNGPKAHQDSRRQYHEVSYQRNGKDPKDVLSYRSDPRVGDLEGMKDNGWVRVEMMHAPWNPADVNTVQGRYPSPYGSSTIVSSSSGDSLRVASDLCLGRYFDKDPVIGSEGWGTVTHSSSSLLPEGTLVTMGLPGLGTLRSSLWVPESAVLPVPNSVHERLGPVGSSLFQLGGTALRLLSDFVTLQPGDLVLQNAGNSGVGFLASQLAASPSLFGSQKGQTNGSTSNECSTPLMVSIIRRHGKSKEGSFEETVDFLTRVGKNAFVIAEEDLFLQEGTTTTTEGKKTKRSINEVAIREMRERLRDLSPTRSLPKLALNAVGGETAKAMLKLLEPNAGSTMVTYGGMSGEGIDVATPQLIFSDVRVSGYWHSRWMVREHRQEQDKRHDETSVTRREAMVGTLSKLVLEENLKCPPAKVVRLEDLHEGLVWQEKQSKGSSEQSAVRTKLVWDCRE